MCVGFVQNLYKVFFERCQYKREKENCRAKATLLWTCVVVVVLKWKMKENKFTDAKEKRRGKGRSKQSGLEVYRIQNIETHPRSVW